MPQLPANLYSVAAVREIDRRAIEDSGVPGYTLMTRAAEASVRLARTHFPTATVWQILCGGGNNGGDGYVVARLAAAEGIEVRVISLADPESLRGDAAQAHADFVATDGVVEPWSGALATDTQLLVDGLLGSGLQRDVSGDFASAVNAINAHRADVLALDIPTGIHGDSGAVQGAAVVADLTVTFVGLKPGLFLGEGPAYCGAIQFAGLDIDPACRSGIEPTFHGVDDDSLLRLLPPRSCSAHKGDFGHVVVVGGGPGMPGAAQLCGEAALRAGAGRVTLATHPAHAAQIAASRPELMVRAIETGQDLESILSLADVVAFGPGLGQTAWSRELFDVVSTIEHRTVWDADALNLLSNASKSVENRIITPHPGEAATLLSSSIDAVQTDRAAAVARLAKQYGGVAVLKGVGTITQASGGVATLCTRGNPGMSAPGMGDALTGIIAALLAQGVSLRDAAAVGVEIHARAGDIAARFGERGMLTSDLIGAIRGVVNIRVVN